MKSIINLLTLNSQRNFSLNGFQKLTKFDKNLSTIH